MSITTKQTLPMNYTENFKLAIFCCRVVAAVFCRCRACSCRFSLFPQVQTAASVLVVAAAVRGSCFGSKRTCCCRETKNPSLLEKGMS